MFKKLKKRIRRGSTIKMKHGNAICYSGYREGQVPGQVYPSYDEIKEDLEILSKNWSHAEVVRLQPARRDGTAGDQ